MSLPTGTYKAEFTLAKNDFIYHMFYMVVVIE